MAAVHLGALPQIKKSWSSPLAAHGLSLQMTGVFCHQSPYVVFGSGKTCELADLLVVVDIHLANRMERRAVLIQAKMASQAKTVSVSGISSLTQLALYQSWPDFDFKDKAYGLTGVNLRHGSDSAHSGTFGVIDRHWNSSAAPRWTQHPASPTPHKTMNAPTLGTFLARMIGRRAGYGRDANPHSRTAWANMIEVLLRENRSKMFRDAPSMGKGVFQPRMMLAFSAVNGPLWPALYAGGFDLPPDVTVVEMDDGPTGISTIHVAVSNDPDFDSYTD